MLRRYLFASFQWDLSHCLSNRQKESKVMVDDTSVSTSTHYPDQFRLSSEDWRIYSDMTLQLNIDGLPAPNPFHSSDYAFPGYLVIPEAT